MITSKGALHHLVLALLFLLSGCAIAPSFRPTTLADANCKTNCGQLQMGCRGSSYTCDQGYNRCIQGCIDESRLRTPQ
jgi:hypothetical protein